MDSNMKGRSRGVQDEEAGFRTRLMFRRMKRRYGHVPLSTRIHAYDPKLLVTQNPETATRQMRL